MTLESVGIVIFLSKSLKFAHSYRVNRGIKVSSSDMAPNHLFPSPLVNNSMEAERTSLDEEMGTESLWWANT